mgnify:CR=1 FL=1
MSSEEPPTTHADQDDDYHRAEASRPTSQAIALPIHGPGETGRMRIAGELCSKVLKIITTGGTVIVVPLGNGDTEIELTAGTDAGALGIHVTLGDPVRGASAPQIVSPPTTASDLAEPGDPA